MAVTAMRESATQPASAETFTDHFADVVRRFSDRTAFRLKTGQGYRQMTYIEVYDRARGVGLGLAASGIRPGERVAVLSENRPEWVVSYLGILMAGATVVPLDAQISPAEWRKLLEDSESRMVFVSGLLAGKLRPVLVDSELSGRWVCFDPVPETSGSWREFDRFLGRAESGGPARALPRAAPADVAVIIYTSGTTGRPKGVMLTHSNILTEITSVLSVIHVDPNDTLLCLLPLQHVFASVVNVLIPLFVGARVTFVDTLKRSEILEALEAAGITILATVPQFFYLFHDRIREELGKKPSIVRGAFRLMLAAHHFCLARLRLNLGKVLFGKIHRTFGSRLRLFVSGGSSFDPKVAHEFHDFGFTILQGYGLTETTGAATATTIEDNRLGSVGKPLPGVEVKIENPDETGIGEIAIRGPIVMKGYYKNPEATAEVLRDGWFYSGDLGRFDRGGNLFITGREKETIVLPSGKNIYPDELETHYQQCPYIQEIAVIGAHEEGSREGAERLHAVVVPNFDYLKARKIANAREILRDEIGRYSNQLPKYKRLTSYTIQKDPLPRTTTRKIKRLELKRLVESGPLQSSESSAAPPAALPEDAELRDSAFGQEVLRCLRELGKREVPADLGMNIELDLGFDSMERVELMASLEQALNLKLPEDFGAEVYTVRDLIRTLQQESVSSGAAATAARQTWKDILSEEALSGEGEWRVRFSGRLLAFFKFLCMKVIHVALRLFFGLEVRGLENLPRSGAFLICPNHLSYIDPFVVLAILPYRSFRRVFFVGASEYFVTWWMKILARLANIVPVDPDTQLLRAMKVGAFGLRQGRVLCIFPEGARSFDGELKELKKGAVILAREIGAPIVPVGIRGTYEVWPRDTWRIRLHKIRLAFGESLSLARPAASDSYRDDTMRLQAEVARLIE